MRSLFKIEADQMALLQLVEQADMGDGLEAGELPEGADSIIDRWLVEIEGEEADKLAGYGNLIRLASGEAEVAKRTAQEFAKKQKVRENFVQRLKDRLLSHMRLTGRDRIKASDGTVFRIQKNSTRSLLVNPEYQIDLVPSEFIYTPPPVIDKAKVKEHLTAIEKEAMRIEQEAGKESADAYRDEYGLEFASLEPAGSHVRMA